ncbi:pyridoxamine 5'-phosphate oxidase family protein [Angustibacter sp. McL0619]|uniref:pyridoxamine 5'-phosphate oxidase family protein n=1 Tax=Angustibacter sp. McL0619 TaxID=3415676 RepID=UPI003CFA57B1
MELQTTDIEQLQEHESWALVRGTAVGRLAVVVDDQPEIFPVNHLVDHADLVFRTAAGTKLSASDGRRVAFEVDGVDVETGQAWSVVLKGRAHVVRKLHDVLDTYGMPLDAWQGGAKPTFVRIQVDEVTGRRFTPTWRRPPT